MKHSKVIFTTYIFLLLILLGLAFAVSLSFPTIENYAFSIAIAVHSIAMLILSVLIILQDEPESKEVTDEVH